MGVQPQATQPNSSAVANMSVSLVIDNTSVSALESYNSNVEENGCSRKSVDSCPVWFTCNDTKNGSCLCGPHKEGILCNQQKLVSAILSCHCVTRVKSETYLGLCFYNCERPADSLSLVYENTVSYHVISDLNTSGLKEYMCGPFNRKGISCGRCEPGHHPFVLSYNLSCVRCPDAHTNWWKFAVYGFVPLTFFYFFVVFFNINVTSSRLHGFILFSQTLSTPPLVRVLFLTTEFVPPLLTFIKLTEPFYSMWNLDLFRSLLPGVCLDVSTLQSFALDACLAVYPMALMLLSYLLIVLYDRDMWCIVLIWKPFHSVFKLVRENWDIRTSVIDSFATFFLLSYVKILSVSTDLMLFTEVYKFNSNKTSYRLYYDSNIALFRGEHTPYAALSVFLVLVFSVFPTLILIVYPFQCFQKCLSYFDIQWHFLHAFVDSFQGCYKDGTEPNTYDYRWFSSYGLVLRLCICALYFCTLSSMFFIYGGLVALVFLILLINFQPYKAPVSHYTTLDASFLILYSLFSTTLSAVNVPTSNGRTMLYVFYGFAIVFSMGPIVYIILIVLHWMYSRRRWGILCLTKIRVLLRMRRN